MTIRAEAATMQRLNRRFVLLMLAPATLFLVLLTLFPFVSTLGLSLTGYSLLNRGVIHWVGLSNYLSLFGNQEFWQAVLTTLIFTVAVVAIEVVIGTGIATLLEQETRGRTFVRTIALLPMVITPVAATFTFRLMFNSSIGVINYLLQVIHIAPQGWFATPGQALMSLVIVDVWQWTPFILLIVSGGLAVLPTEPFEAARVDGANRWQIFVNITLPMLRPYISVAMVLRLVDALKTFDIIYILTGGGPGITTETLNILAFKQGIQFLQMGVAAAISIVMLILSIAVAQLLVRTTGLFDLLEHRGGEQ